MAIQKEGFAKPQAMSWKPGAPGDSIQGIFTGIVKDYTGEYGTTKIYEIVGVEGSWNVNDADDKPTGVIGKVEPGGLYSIWERMTFADDIKRAKRGQQIIVEFVDVRKNKNGKSYKYVECQLGPMDAEWLEANSEFAKPASPASEDKPF